MIEEVVHRQHSISVDRCCGLCCLRCLCRFGSAPSPVNGVVALPMRLLGAATPSEACGNATSPACVLAGVGTDSYAASRIECVVPPGVGVGFQMLIRDTWTSLVPNGAKAGYSPPAITAVAPAMVPAAGGELTITGSGFGPGPCTDVNRTSDVQVCHRVCSLF
jgi:hypothetical protein